MPFVRRVKYLAPSILDAVDKVKDDMVSMGWTLHDDQSSVSSYCVLCSAGENDNLPIVYVKLDWASLPNLRVYLYLYWNNTSHVGIVSMHDYTNHVIVLNANDPFYLWVYGDKNFITILSNIGSFSGVSFGEIKLFANNIGVLQSAVSSGSNVVLTLAANETCNFKLNKYYQIVGLVGEGRDRVQVTGIDPGSNQITIGNLPRNYGINSIIGSTPWPWIIVSTISLTIPYNLWYDGVGTAAEINHNNMLSTLIDSTYSDPDMRLNSHMLIPYYFKEYNLASIFGYIDNYIMKITIGSDDDIATSGELDNGISSGSNTSTILNDTIKSWTSNEWQDKCLAIVDGVGSGQIRKISTNTATVLTVDADWDIIPDDTSEYIICDHGWRIFYFNNASYRKAIMEV